MKKLICCIISLAIISSLFLTSYADINKSSKEEVSYSSEKYVKSNVSVNVPKIVVFSSMALCPVLRVPPPPQQAKVNTHNMSQVAFFSTKAPMILLP